jgi:hypothetical protein
LARLGKFVSSPFIALVLWLLTTDSRQEVA